ncbi:MAG: hypothetical protein K0R36_2677 [Chryseobacterium sp.]|jgi:hypothetical protein|nr:hypothetical protein [Chryseobacterium sp.]
MTVFFLPKNFHQVKTSIHQVCQISVEIRGNFTLEIKK